MFFIILVYPLFRVCRFSQRPASFPSLHTAYTERVGAKSSLPSSFFFFSMQRFRAETARLGDIIVNDVGGAAFAGDPTRSAELQPLGLTSVEELKRLLPGSILLLGDGRLVFVPFKRGVVAKPGEDSFRVTTCDRVGGPGGEKDPAWLELKSSSLWWGCSPSHRGRAASPTRLRWEESRSSWAWRTPHRSSM